jgi:hypothetical protein
VCTAGPETTRNSRCCEAEEARFCENAHTLSMRATSSGQLSLTGDELCAYTSTLVHRVEVYAQSSPSSQPGIFISHESFQPCTPLYYPHAVSSNRADAMFLFTGIEAPDRKDRSAIDNTEILRILHAGMTGNPVICNHFWCQSRYSPFA